jgi:hypothetical protein
MEKRYLTSDLRRRSWVLARISGYGLRWVERYPDPAECLPDSVGARIFVYAGADFHLGLI